MLCRHSVAEARSTYYVLAYCINKIANYQKSPRTLKMFQSLYGARRHDYYSYV